MNEASKAIAVIGLSARFPGAGSIDEFWANLLAGKSSIAEVPPERWDAAAWFDPEIEAPNKSNSKWGGFLHGVDLFDPLFFGISPREAALMDPQQRLFLEEAWNALENAGYAAESLGNSDCGVFAGIGNGDYLDIIERQAGISDGYVLTGNTVSTYPGRVAYFLNLKGPCLSIDTACSSSLVAIHLACESIRTGRAGMAIAGGVSVMTTPKAFIIAGKTGLLSPDGLCGAFDESAGGYVPGEASVVLVLKSFDRAVQDGDHIHAVILGSAINHDGRTNGLTAPSAQAQSALQEEILQEAGVSPESISLVEAMATGTHLGDAIEVNGLTATFRKQTVRRGFCPIGSLKTNVGHSGHPSGAAGLVKIILAMANGKIPASLNHVTDNVLAKFGDSPFFVADRTIDWNRTAGTPRRALLNSFGHSGTNACVVVEEPPESPALAGSEPPYLLTLSGKSEEALRARIRGLRAWWERSGTDIPMADVAFTLNSGRSSFRHRVALVANDQVEVLRQLSLLSEGNTAENVVAGISPANVPANPDAAAAVEALCGLLGRGSEVDSETRRKALTALARAYVNGFAINWSRAEAYRSARRIPLPGYPFARERHWVRPGRGGVITTPGPSAASASGVQFFAPIWVPAERTSGTNAAARGALLVFDTGEGLYAELRRLGCEAILVEPGPRFEALAPDHFAIRPSETGDYTALIARLREKDIVLRGGIYAWGRSAISSSASEASGRAAGLAWGLTFDAFFLLIKALAGSVEKYLPIVFAYAATEEQSAIQASIGGLARCLPHETPRLSCKVLQFEPEAGVAEWASQALAELGDFGPEEIAFRGGRRWVRRFESRALQDRNPGVGGAFLPRIGGTYIISGGAGALGQIFAGYLSREFKANVALLGRSSLSEDRRIALEGLSAPRTRIVYLQADVADYADVERAVAECRSLFGPLNGVIHAAGILHDGLLGGKDLAAMHRVLAPKAEGILNLDAATRNDPLDFFAVFSSIASVTGNIGQIDYAVANRFLDAFAGTRDSWRLSGRRRGKTIALNWPYWKDGGMRPPDETVALVREVFGLSDLGTENGWRAFLAGLESSETQLVVIEGAAEGMLPLLNPPIRRLFDEEAIANNNGPDPELLSRIERVLVASLSDLLQLDAARIQSDSPITELGVDSMVFTQLVLRLNRKLGLKLTPALLFEYPTIRSFAEFLASNHAEKLGALERLAQALPAAAPTPVQTGVPMRFPLSAGQQALWFLSQLSPENYAYNLPIVLPLAAPVDRAAIQRALEALCGRHGALRTVFRAESGQPWQFVLPNLEVLLPSVSMGEQTRDKMEAAMRDAHRVPFALDTGPLWRAKLFARKGESTLLLITIHHLIFDGASAAIFIEEFLALYVAAKTGDTVSLSVPGRRYDEFVGWQHDLLAGDEGPRLWDYWSREMAGEIPVLNMPTDRGRPAVQTYQGDTIKFEIDEACARVLRDLAAAENATLYMVILGAFFVLLHRYSGQDDLVVGSPMMGRNESGFGRTVGYFINVVALRCNMTGDPSFRTFLGTVRGKVYGALEHQDFPLPQLVQRLKLPRDPSRSPLFQVEFNLETWAKRNEGGPKVSPASDLAALEPFEWLHQEGEFDLALDIFELDRPLKSAFRFNPDLFDRSTVERMAEHFRRLLAEIAADPGRPVSSLPMLGGPEREQLLLHWNNTHQVFPSDACLHDLIAEQASRYPGRTAVVCGNVRLSYAELNDRADRWARVLSRLGAGRGTRLGICLDRSEAMIVSVLAVMKTGAAYVPLDPAFPPERLEFMAANAELHSIITHKKMASWPAFKGQRCLCVDVDGSEIFAGSGGEDSAGEPTRRLADDSEVSTRDSSPDDTVYILYTSGSTGRPKGVEITHRSLINFLWSMADEPGLSKNDVLLAVTTLSFDIAALELFLPLVRGAQVTIAAHDDTVDGRRLLRLLKTSGATAMQATPATWTMLLESGWNKPLSLKVLCGGEALSRSLADRLLELGLEVWNLFGPTETTVWSTVARVTAGTDPVSIGRPIANTQIYVLDARMQPVPIGVPGELYIGGAGVARGYWRNPELTAERFVTSPYGRSDSDRLYKTGDIAKWRRSGVIDFLGRADNQVKIRGFRIELGEVEKALNLHPAVAQSVVMAREDRPGDRRLVAYWIGNGAEAPSVVQLRARLQTVLPDYMIPSAFVLLKSFPLTPNGKIDRKQLPVPDRERPADVAYVGPRNEIERALGGIWAEAIGLSKVGIRDNFFELGGHSLLATEVVRQTRLIYEIELLDLFTYPTIQTLAEFIADRGRAGIEPAPKPSATAAFVGTNRLEPAPQGVAIVGVAGRFPGAIDVATFWENLKNGVESITRFTDEELLNAGIPKELLVRPNYVKAGGVLEGADCFDADFFGYSQMHARLMDPQQRILLEAAWETLDDAGCNPESLGRRIGVFAGIGANTYYNPDVREISEKTSAAAASLAFTSVEKDFAATRISYKMNLTGPSMTVQTACSSSLVAIHIACQSIANGECEAALAGGVSVLFPQITGYLHQKDMALSPDGHCRAFDAQAEGTVFTNGVAMVLLKPLARALADRDQIYAVIRGTAIGNDGNSKVDYMAPSVQGQSEVVARALRMADIGAETIGLVEAHGTGTAVGDPIEVRALSDVFRKAGAPVAGCALGSLKTNVGHLNTASGAAGLIKAALCLKDRIFVPSLNFRVANPHIDLANSPFYVSTRMADWSAGAHPRRAAVSSLGIGGTNAHAVLEEPPALTRAPEVRAWRLLPLSAKTPSALRATVQRLAAHVARRGELALADIAFTLQTGRAELDLRHFVVSNSRADAIRQLGDNTATDAWAAADSAPLPVVFLFSGEGAPGRGSELYRSEPTFRAAIDAEAERLTALLGSDPRRTLFPSESERMDAAKRWDDPNISLPLVVLFEHAMWSLWKSWGVRPDAVVGHGWGEYSAGIAAGVFSAADILQVLCARVGNSHGVPDAKALGTSWRGLQLTSPRVPLASSTTGGRVEDLQALQPSFWMSIDRAGPRSAEAIITVKANAQTIVLDMASGTALGAYAKREGGIEVLESLGAGGTQDDSERLLRSLGRLWQVGKEIQWAELAGGEAPRKASLPSYPFERKRFWLDQPETVERPKAAADISASSNRRPFEGAPPDTRDPRQPGGTADAVGQAGLEPVLMNGGEPHFKLRLSEDVFYFRDHVIAGKMIVPGAVILELARAAGALAFPGRIVSRLREAVWIRPISEARDGPEVHIHLIPSDHGASYEVRSFEAGSEQVHAKGKLEFGEPSGPIEMLPIDEIRSRCPLTASGDETYRIVRELGGMEYGPSMCCVESMSYSPTEVLARLRAPDGAWLNAGAYELNPSLIDGFFQTMMLLVRDRAVADKTPYLPYAMSELVLRGILPRECFVHTVQRDAEPSEKSKQTRTFHIKVADVQGRVIAEVRDYSVKFFPQGRLAAAMETPQREKAEVRAGGRDFRNMVKNAASVPAADHGLARREICARLQTEVAGLLGVAAETLDTSRDMGDYGMDSVLVIDFISAVNDTFGLSLSPAIFFEHRSLDEFTDFLVAQHPALARLSASGVPPVGQAGVAGDESNVTEGKTGNGAKPIASDSRAGDPGAIAIVGMAGVFPQSPDLATFWSHLVAGRNLITEIPADRWNWRDYYGDPQDGNKTNIKWGGFIGDVDKFDPRFFKLSPRDAEFMDPQQRIFLETVWKTIEDAGYAPSQVAGTRTGLFVGVSSVDYQEVVMKNMGVVDVKMGAGLPIDMLPNRISYLLNLQGPSEPVSTACSSSLVALHRAIDAIRRGDCDQAIVGGVNLLLTPTPFIYFGKAGILSIDGQCRTFDHRANGYVRGEGAGAVFVKTLHQAVADGDHIYGLIKGTAVNHGGRTRTFGAPSPQAEALVVREAFERAGVSPASVSYIEAHGTGTALGDPVEISGLNKAFGELSAGRGESPAVGSCGVGSVKTNVGHLEAAAGIVGLIKVLLAIKHRKIPASLHLEKPNPFIQMAGSPFYFVDRTMEWVARRDSEDRPLPRRAGISSFGFGGVNSHVVVEEFPVTPKSAAQSGPELLVLSARALPQLQAAARSLCDWIERTSDELSDPNYATLAETAFTLQVGRDAMAERLAIIAATRAEAATALRIWLDGKPCAGLFQGHVSQRREPGLASWADGAASQAEASYREGRLADLAQLWISDEAFSWEYVRRSSRGNRVSLPTYSFARERYWLEPQPGSVNWPAEIARDPLEDILQQVRSNSLSAEDAAALLEVLAPDEAKNTETDAV